MNIEMMVSSMTVFLDLRTKIISHAIVSDSLLGTVDCF